MNEQAEEWEDMSETQRSEIKARLMAACDNEHVVGYRARLARASRSHYPQATDQS